MPTNRSSDITVSIIIPIYNVEPYIKATLDSILQQDFNLWECILVDDGSTDRTIEIVESYCKNDLRISLYRKPDYLTNGPSASRNFGFEKSKGNWILWFDGDDIMLKECLTKRINLIKPNTDVVVSSISYAKHPEMIPFKKTKINSDNLIKDYLIGKVSYYPSGGLWSRSFLTGHKPIFDPKIQNLDDWDFNLRLLYRKPNMIFLYEPTVLYRVRPDSLSQEIKKLNIEQIKSEIYARRKHIRILKEKYPRKSKLLAKYLEKRFLYFLKRSLLLNKPLHYWFYRELVFQKAANRNYIGVIYTFFSYSFYRLFGRGYFLLK